MKVLIVDDHPIVLSGCRALLAAEPDLEMLEACDAETAQTLFASHRPDVVVIDINLPGVSGFELSRRLLIRNPDTRILIFSMNDDAMFAAQSIESGAKGYISKNDNPADFLRAIWEVAQGGIFLPEGMAQKIAFLRVAGPGSMIAKLTAREREVLHLLAKGQSMSEIGGALNVSYKTVATTCAALRTKLNARTPMELVRIAIEQKLV